MGNLGKLRNLIFSKLAYTEQQLNHISKITQVGSLQSTEISIKCRIKSKFLSVKKEYFVKKQIQRFLSKKRNIAILVVLFSLIVIAASYTIHGILENTARLSEITEPVSYFPDYPQSNTSGKTPQEIEQIRRGEYLTKAGDCIACHTNSTKAGSPAFAGGLPMETPFGTIFSPNITPHPTTGIGTWTDAQFIKAMREGISPQGKRYYPAFPYLYFNKVTDEDLKAIKAYLSSIPPVNQPNLENTMVWPFNFRFLQSGWRLLFFLPQKTGPFQHDPNKSDQWNRGAYLVEGLGHCAMCHTPSYYIFSKQFPLGAPIQKYNLTGAPIQGYLAPNITKSNLASIPDEELLRVFTHNQLIGGGSVEGPMLEANQNSLKYLTRADMLAIITYLKSVESKSPPLPRGGVGKALYQNYCAGCHANGGGGAPVYGDPTSWAHVMTQDVNTIYNNAIKGIGGMPAKGTCLSCSDEDIKHAVDYMLSSVKGKKVKTVPPLKKLTLEDGKKIYEANCSLCHATGFKNAPPIGNKLVWQPIIDKGFLEAYQNMMTGKKGHPPHGSCIHCTDAELIAATKYMMTKSSDNDYSLW